MHSRSAPDRWTHRSVARPLVLLTMLGVLVAAGAGAAAARTATACGSLTIHEGAKSATESDITADGVTCAYVKTVFLPKAAIASPAAAKFFSAWAIKATRVTGGLTEFTCRHGKETITYRVKAG